MNTRLLVKTLNGMTLIPTSAIQHNGAGLVRLRDSERRRRRCATSRLGKRTAGMTAVEGIHPGDVVANSSFEKLQAERQGDHLERRATGGEQPDSGQREPACSMSPSRPFILRPVATSLLMAAILLVGIVAYTQLPVSALPQVDYPTIQVLTFYPGASPDVVATTVTAPLERQFGQMQGLSQMTSTSSGAISVIVLQFNLSLNIDVAEEEVQSAINAAQSFLPSVLPAPPIYSKTNPADAPVLTLAITSDSMPLSQVEDLVDTRLAPKLSQLNGVGLVSISGGQKPAVRIQANPAALASYGITLEQLRTALIQTSVNAAKGNFDGPRQDYQIDANDQLQRSDDYRNVVVAYRNGAPVMLEQRGQVVDGVENNNQAAWMNQTPAVILNIQRQPGANTISVVKSIKAILPQLEANLPAAIKVTQMTDLTVPIQASVSDVEFELMLTVVLVVLVIFLFLRSLRATIIPSVAVPISLVGTLGAMYVLGYSLDNLSMMALTIATGFVVDDAIVMIENISRYLEEGDPPMEAALKGAEQIGFTILSLTVSLIAVLIPLLFMGDVVGRLFREFAVTLAVTIVISAVVSLTLTPMMCCAHFCATIPKEQQTRFYRASERAFESMIAFYGRTLKFVLRYQTITLLVALGHSGADRLSLHHRPQRILSGAGYRRDSGHLAGAGNHLVSGHGAEAAGAGQGDSGRSRGGEPVLLHRRRRHQHHAEQRTLLDQSEAALRPRHAAPPDVIRRLQTKLQRRAGHPALHAAGAEHHGGRPREPHPVSVHARRSRSPDELNLWTNRFVEQLKKLPDLEDVATDQQTGGLAVSLVIDRVTASRLGIAPSTIDNTLYDAYGQRQISTMYTQLNQYHVILETLPEFQKDPSKLASLYIQSNASSGAIGTRRVHHLLPLPARHPPAPTPLPLRPHLHAVFGRADRASQRA